MAEAKKIIKKTATRTDLDLPVSDGSSVIESDVYEASQTAKDIIAKAQRQADELIAKATEERDRVLKEAQDNGYQEGLAKSTEYVVKAKEFYQRTAENSKNELKALAVKIAEKIVGKTLESDPELINDVVSQAIRTLRQQKNVTVRCNEDDLRILKKNEKEFVDQMGQGGVINFVEDPKIARGGCMIESEVGIVDARLETQLKTIQKILMSK